MTTIALVLVAAICGVSVEAVASGPEAAPSPRDMVEMYLKMMPTCTVDAQTTILNCDVNEATKKNLMCLPPLCKGDCDACVNNGVCIDLLADMFMLEGSTDIKALGKAKGALMSNSLGKAMMGCMMAPMNQLYFSPCEKTEDKCFYPFAWCDGKCQPLERCDGVTPECQPEPVFSGAQPQRPLYWDGSECTVKGHHGTPEYTQPGWSSTWIWKEVYRYDGALSSYTNKFGKSYENSKKCARFAPDTHAAGCPDGTWAYTDGAVTFQFCDRSATWLR